MKSAIAEPGAELIDAVRKALKDVWSGGRPDAVEECFTPDYVRHDPYAPGIVKHAGIRKLVKTYRDAFPDMEFNLIDESLCVGRDRVAAKYWVEGTHRAKLLQIETTDRAVLFTGTGIWRIVDGRVAEDWHNYDTQTFFTALGILPCVGHMLEDH